MSSILNVPSVVMKSCVENRTCVWVGVRIIRVRINMRVRVTVRIWINMRVGVRVGVRVRVGVKVKVLPWRLVQATCGLR